MPGVKFLLVCKLLWQRTDKCNLLVLFCMALKILRYKIFLVILTIYIFFQGCIANKKLQVNYATNATDTTNVPMIIRPLSDGSLLLRSEYGRPIGPKIKYMPKLRVYGYFTAEDRVEWDVEVGKTGMYEVYMEWAIFRRRSGKEICFYCRR